MGCCGGGGGPIRKQIPAKQPSRNTPQVVRMAAQAAQSPGRQVEAQRIPTVRSQGNQTPRPRTVMSQIQRLRLANNQCKRCGYPTMLVYIAGRERSQCTNADCRAIN